MAAELVNCTEKSWTRLLYEATSQTRRNSEGLTFFWLPAGSPKTVKKELCVEPMGTCGLRRSVRRSGMPCSRSFQFGPEAPRNNDSAVCDAFTVLLQSAAGR